MAFTLSLRPRPIMRERLAGFIGAEIGRSADEIIIDIGKPNACIHGRRIRSQPEVKVVRFIELPGI